MRPRDDSTFQTTLPITPVEGALHAGEVLGTEERRMSRFVLGVLVGALAMHWYAVYGGTAVGDVVDWFQDTAGGYGTASE